MNRVSDVFLTDLFIGRYKRLMRRKTAQVESSAERVLFQFLKIAIRFVFHLDVQDFDSIESHIGGQVNAFLDASQRVIAKLPE